LWLFRNIGNLEFEPWHGYGVFNGWLRTPRVGDYDNDGKVDIALSMRAGFTGTLRNYVYIYYGTCAAACRGDFDGDDVVNIFDLFRLLSEWGPCAACGGDLNHDGTVNASDLHELLAAWGSCE
jgi:hypothetical protein